MRRTLGDLDLEAMSNVDGAPDPVTIGASQLNKSTGFEGWFRGSIDEVAYYTSALTATEAAAIHDADNGECQ